MDKRIAGQVREVEHYLEMTKEHLRLDQPDEAEGWCSALIDEAKKLRVMCGHRAVKAGTRKASR